MAQIPAVHRPRHIGGVAVPVQQIERRGRFALEVVAHHIVPHQIVRAQKAEGRGQLLALQQAWAFGGIGADGFFALLHHLFINKKIQDAVAGKVDQGRQQGDAFGRLFASGRQHGQGRGEDGAADAKTQGVDGLAAADLLHHLDGADGRLLDVVVPGPGLATVIRIAPADDKHPVALRHRVADQGVLGLQVKDVVLVDAGWHHQQRALEHLGRQGLVLDQLKKRVLEDDAARGGGHIDADLKRAFVGLRHMAALHIAPQLLQALGQAFAPGFQREGLRLGVQRQEIAGRGGIDKLLHREAHALARLLLALDLVGHGLQGFGIEQVKLGDEGRSRVGAPGRRGKAAVFEGGCGGLVEVQRAVPQLGCLLQVVGLQAGQRRHRNRQSGHGLPHIAQIGRHFSGGACMGAEGLVRFGCCCSSCCCFWCAGFACCRHVCHLLNH